MHTSSEWGRLSPETLLLAGAKESREGVDLSIRDGSTGVSMYHAKSITILLLRKVIWYPKFSHIIFTKNVILKKFLLLIVIQRWINTYFAVSIHTLKHYVTRCIDTSSALSHLLHWTTKLVGATQEPLPPINVVDTNTCPFTHCMLLPVQLYYYRLPLICKCLLVCVH